MKPARFFKNRSGSTAVEFALLAPILVTLYMGTVEFQDYFTVDRKLTAMTSATGDVISQDDIVSNAEMNDVFTAITTMMEPYETGSLKLRISRVDVDTQGAATAVWSDAQNWTGHPAGSTYPLPTDLIVEDQNNPGSYIPNSYIVAESNFSYESVISFMVSGGVSLNRVFYIHPRYVAQITRIP